MCRSMITCGLVWILTIGISEAANHYVRDGGSASTAGTGSCTSWVTANACDDLPATLVRGDSYFIADGSYGTRVFSTATSGTTTITLKKATAGDHGTDTGWDNTYGDGQAIWTGSWEFRSAYWDINGQVGGGPSDWAGTATPLGFKLFGDGIGIYQQATDFDADNITIQHLEIDGTVTTPGFNRAIEIKYMNNLTLSYLYLHNVGFDCMGVTSGANNFTFQYSKAYLCPIGQDAAHHGDLMEVQFGSFSDWIVRWNYFQDVVGTYLLGAHDTASITNYTICGNIFHFKSKESDTGNGTFGRLMAGSGPFTNASISNNTIAGIFGASALGFYGATYGTGNVARNNLWYEGTDNGYSFSYSDVSQSYNSHYNMASVSGTGNENPTGNPFVDIANDNLRLTGPTTAGTSAATNCTTDMVGSVRGNDGVVDRGALEFTGASSPAPVRLRIAWSEWLSVMFGVTWITSKYLSRNRIRR